MRTFAQKPTTNTTPGRAHLGQGRTIDSIPPLQRTSGNRSVRSTSQIHPEEHAEELTGAGSPGLPHDFSQIPIYPESLINDRAQGSTPNPHFVGASKAALQHKGDGAPQGSLVGSPETPRLKSQYRGIIRNELRDNLSDLADSNVTSYVSYRDAISKSTPIQKRASLNTVLLSKLRDTMDYLSFARCVELLGRRAPTFDELRTNSVVLEAITDAWNASDIGVRDLVTQPHEEGGWVFLNLIDGSLSIRRAKAEGTNFIKVEPPPDVEDSVLVAIFHTHPGPRPFTAQALGHDKVQDARRGVPNLVIGSTGANPAVFQIHLSGPAVRKHLASATKIPGPGGGLAPY